jgi:NHLM bacteriocin system ABC transporter ATP-binding protein
MNAAELRKSGKWDFFLLRLRYREGRIVEVAGNEPIILDDAATAWIVYAGEIDVFWVPVERGTENNAPVGARHHLFRAEEGTGLFGIAPDHVGLLANGAPGSQLLRVRRSTLEEMSNEPDFIDPLAFVVDSWIGGLSGGITHQLVPREFKVLESRQEAVLDAGEIAHTRKGVLWLRHLEGSSSYTGRQDIPPLSGGDVAPISSDTWIDAAEPTRLAVVDTQSALEQHTLWPDLARFHRLVLDCIAGNAAQTATAEYQRLESRNAADIARTDAALSRLASVLHAESSEQLVSADGQPPLLTACQLVASALGSSIQVPAGVQIDLVNGNQRDTVRRIAQIARMRTRQVGLRGEWWRTESGPLLGFLEQEPPRPVALLPESTRGYTLYDPVAQTATPVNAEIAASLSQFATMFYRPFPAKSLSVGDIVRFGLHGTRRDLLTIALMAVLAGLLGTLAPVLTGIIFDRILPSAQRAQLLQVALVLFVSAVSVVLFQVTRSIAVLRIEGKMEASIQAAVLDRLLDLPATFFRSYSAGDLGIRALGISAIRQILSRVALSAIFAGLTSLFSLGLLFVYDRQLAGSAVFLAAIYVGIVIAISYVQVRYERRLADIQGKIAGTVLQFINGIAKFRVAGAERRAFAHWAQQFTEQRKLAYRARTIGNGLAAFSSAFSLFTSMVIFGLIVLSSSESGGNRLSTGSFLAFNFAFGQFLVSALSLSAAFTATLRVVPMFERARPIFQTLPEVDETKDDPGELGGEIEINSVSFRYTPDGPLVLNDVSLHVEPGQFVAFVGPSGSGKSTILRLLLGFERPESGAIFYDGQDLTALDIHAVRRQIGTVLQTSRLMTGDIFTNIVGTSGLTIDDAWEAARMAGLENDIQAMPMGMHTVISEGGTTLSGGQRQRLMIARAIVNKPRIIFFDEATSALDNRTQEIVSKSLQNLEATRVVIAHRLSTIMHADQIFVIDGGRVVQSGSYNDLLNQPGLFSTLARRQLL